MTPIMLARVIKAIVTFFGFDTAKEMFIATLKGIWNGCAILGLVTMLEIITKQLVK